MPNDEPKFILFDFDSLVPTFGREDRRGNPESLLIDLACLEMLRAWKAKAAHPHLVVFRFLTEVEQLRKWIRRSPLSPYFSEKNSCFGGSDQFESEFMRIAHELGMPGRGEEAAWQVDVVSESGRVLETAASFGWTIRSQGTQPDGGTRKSLDTLVRLTVDNEEWKVLQQFSVESPTSGFTPLTVDCIEDKVEIFALLPKSALATLETKLASGFDVATRNNKINVVGGYEPGCDLVEIIHGAISDGERESFGESLRCHRFVEPVTRGFVVGVDPTSRIPIPHPPSAPHGHTVLLGPRKLVSPLAAASIRTFGYELTPGEIATVDSTTCREFESIHRRLCGSQSLLNGRRISGRSVRAPEQNLLATRFVANQLRRTLGERHVFQALDRYASRPFFNVDSRIMGQQSEHEVVILGAHLDSHAQWGGNAPGADDDASGVVAVLLAARRLADLARDGKPRRTIRFVLFNNEESGMVGSAMYVKHLNRESARSNQAVAAMIQLDMIGWKGERYANVKPMAVRGPGRWMPEVPTLRQHSTAIAEAIEGAAAQTGLLHVIESVQVADEKRDPLAERSDHRRFYESGYPACLVVERGVEFANSGSPDSPPKFNPTYHTSRDVEIDYCLATSVAKIVTAAVWKIANS